MQRRDFLTTTGVGLGVLLAGGFGHAIAAEEMVTRIDVARKKQLADAAMTAAKGAGATYCDVRIGRYLRQFLITREDKVENVVNTESTGIGIRVIANGTWGFAATRDLGVDAVARAARRAVAIAKANAKLTVIPVQLAPVTGVGEVSWATPIVKNAMAIPIKEKLEYLLEVNAAALKAGADFVDSTLFQINEQKYFASTDGSYIDQDIHRIWAPFTVSAVDKASGKFSRRTSLGAPMGMGYEYLDGRKQDKIELPSGSIGYINSYDMREDAVAAAGHARRSSRRRRSSPASTTWSWIPRIPG